ncbi:tRNA pseudouridine(38-40) synthase TruA [Chamaesiphon polymorphus]|uniref:tRNA pseudouridine synthase A n=1 Tax=Chamaesiphon polymorphus CCALA 037 TaxID=2107692 RepID=A0A2T1GLC4_9CYAN|nr:tRNA pseudouridine(38-40) synthase TruA [Chamaesiphon polymorphus]PSB58666.1 tRNA pseudouridine(38-40) synthase TruA [Chamaesiphon polymorphus CCALA 037]
MAAKNHKLITNSPSQRVALVIQYSGTHLLGWQKQPQGRTVQSEIERAIAKVLDRSVSIYGAGRTDSGVHAAAQVAHFDNPSVIPANSWAAVLNSRLPDDIVIRASAPVDDRWHARFSASYRRYRYTIYTAAQPNLFVRPYSWHYYQQPLVIERMQAAVAPMLGTHHLAAFHRTDSGRSHSWVDIQDVGCYQSGDFVHIEIQANGFLYGMVRLLVGLLIQVGNGDLSIAEFTKIWQTEQRSQVRHSAPAKGLCLLRVGYPDFPFPKSVWYDTQPQFLLPTA